METERDDFIPSGDDGVPDEVNADDHEQAQPPDADDDHVVEETGSEQAG
jgi:hypothetical protein